MALSGVSSLEIFHIDNYTFGTKDAYDVDDDGAVALASRMTKLEEEYNKNGMRRTVEAIPVVHDHGHPHVLLLQIGENSFKLPGGELVPGEDEVDGLKKRLDHKLAPLSTDRSGSAGWDVDECVAIWWRPNFETFMYPYIPAHISHPKEQKKIFLLRLPEKRAFAVPKNYKLLAVPLCELYDNAANYGPIISSIPHLLSRFNLIAS